MPQYNLAIIIEGDFLDSYIYSGYLFLVGHDYRITIYKWEELLEKAVDKEDVTNRSSLLEVFKDSRVSIGSELDGTKLNITNTQLHSCKIFSYEVGVWPSDINIYSNVFYISSEKGVSSLKFNWDKGISLYISQQVVVR